MAKQKITIEELSRKLADLNVPEKELEKYFAVDEAASGPFDPVLQLDGSEVQVPETPEGRARSAALLNSANFISRMRRQSAFHNRIGSGTYKGPVIVSEGDSWFQYPIRLEDVIDHLMADYAIFCVGAAGDTLQNMFNRKEYLGAIEETGASIFLMSGGGNDLVAGGNLAAHLFDFNPSLSPEQHLRPSFNTLLDDAIGIYGKLVREVAQAFPSVQIICHGYDYVAPAAGKWIGKPMATRGITKPELQSAIATVMVDRFNKRLSDLARTSARMNYIDCRGIVAKTQWYDELHPTDPGYGKVAKKFKTLIGSLAPKSKGMPKSGIRRPLPSERAAAGPVGLSLHIGLNYVDPDHYAGWDGELSACEFDAHDMEGIAKGLGYQTSMLIREKATRKGVIDGIRKAAKKLKAGDIFFITYSGHGGQVPDFNGDEEDGIDETWCLFDGQVIDDELYQLWSEFAEGVRVLVLSDSCHSGSVVRNMQSMGLMAEDGMEDTPGERPRTMPLAVASRTFRDNRDFYTKLGRSLDNVEASIVSREMKSPVSCTVRLISGCQDNQLSLDGIGNGAFTSALIATWDNGRFQRDYTAFHHAIMMRLPPSQTPNHWCVGAPNPVFDAQTPFAI